MVSRVSTPDSFPQLPIMAGAAPAGPNRQFVVGREDLTTAITRELGGQIPPGTTMTAKYDKDSSGAIKATLHNTEDIHKIPMFTFWRTFTVEVPGQGTYQFRQQIFTNIPVPLEGGLPEYQKSLELAAMACSAYSKLQNDAILVKGGGVSQLGLDDEKINLLQQKTLVDLGVKLSDYKGKKPSDIKSFQATVGTAKITFNLDDIKPGKKTSMRSRHQKFTIENPTVKYTKERVKQLTEMVEHPESFANEYMDGGRSEDAKALKGRHQERTTFKVIGEIQRSHAATARELYNEGGRDSLKTAYASLGADLRREIDEIQSQRDYLSKEKPTLFWGVESLRLKKQQSKMESQLRKLQNDWPGLFEDIRSIVNSPVNADHPKAAQFKREAINDGVIDSTLQTQYISAKVDIEVAASSSKDLQAKIGEHTDQLETLNEEIAKGGDPELIKSLQNQAKALEELIAAETNKLDELELITNASKIEVEAAKKGDLTPADATKLRKNANDKEADVKLKRAQSAMNQAKGAVVGARKKVAEDAGKVAEAEKNRKTEEFKKEAEALAPSEREAFVAKKLEMDKQFALIQAKRAEFEQLKRDLAAVQAVQNDPLTPGVLLPFHEEHKKAIEALIKNAENSLEIESLNHAVMTLELANINTKGSDADFKAGREVSEPAKNAITMNTAEAKAKKDNAVALTKDLKTDELGKALKTAKNNVTKARDQLNADMVIAEANWGAEIDALPGGDNKAAVKAMHEDFVEHNREMKFLQGALLNNPQEIAKLEKQVNDARDPQIKDALQTKLQAQRDLSTAYETQLKAEESIVMMAKNTLFSFRKANYAADPAKLQTYKDHKDLQIQAKTAALNARGAAEFTIKKFDKQAEVLQNVKRREANIALLNKELGFVKAEMNEPNKKRELGKLSKREKDLEQAIQDETKHLASQKKLAEVNARKIPRNDPQRAQWNNEWEEAVKESDRTKKVREATAKPLLKELADEEMDLDEDDEDPWDQL